ncbi:hypothetical protein PR048_009094 [Dryococelus australis]|uniref:Uncharacterized protein n=1 Tax=Dryococelus australis TaxID=614101 RepID=A0ABQ9HYZ4_9NEOP|nr:hypothetical protein PR048_009094 [Dryococelus australis]
MNPVPAFAIKPTCCLNSSLDSFDNDLNNCNDTKVLIVGNFNLTAGNLKYSKLQQYQLVYMSHGLITPMQ